MVCFRRYSHARKRGFSIVEIVVVLGILAFLFGSSLVAVSALREGTDTHREARNLQRVLELARNRTIASKGDARHGVYIDSGANAYVLFEGNSYASRVEEETFQLRATVEFGTVSFGGGQEVVFDRLQGTTSQIGSVSLRNKANVADARTVYVQGSGAVEIDNAAAPSDVDRVSDSRHVHIDYTGRIMNTSIETIVLDFGTATETIVMQDNLSGGQIVWEGTVLVDGEPQTLKIHTHKLNDGFDSQFSVHRDRRPNMNTKPLTIEIGVIPGPDPDPDSGTLIQYDAAGVVTPGTSAFVLAGATQEQ